MSFILNKHFKWQLIHLSHSWVVWWWWWCTSISRWLFHLSRKWNEWCDGGFTYLEWWFEWLDEEHVFFANQSSLILEHLQVAWQHFHFQALIEAPSSPSIHRPCSMATPTDESLFFLIPLPFCAHLEFCLVLNCLLLVHFPQLGFIGPFFWILSNLTLIGLIFLSNYF